MQPREYITTYKKHRFSPLNPRHEDIDIEDIAHALSLMCRANGHFVRFFSIARHCINCAVEAENRGLSESLQLVCLLHDASEAYISDITRPVKLGLPEYSKIEKRLQSVIFEKFKATPTASDWETVGAIDDMMLKLEFATFAGEVIEIQTQQPVIPPDFASKTFERDEADFLQLFRRLQRCV